MVCKAPKYVYMCGKIVPEIKAYLEKIDTKGKIQSDYELIPAIDCKEKILTKDISQTSISMIYATGIDFKSDLYYPLLMANSIFGQNAMSLLFQTVREKYSYCYNISSGLLRFDGAMMVSVGTQRENVEKVIELTDKQLELLVSGDWDDDLLDIAKKDLIDSLTTQQDYPASMIEQEFLDAMLERQTTPEERLEAIRSVTKEQVCAAASRWKKVSCAIVQEEDNEV
jgi:predicted Zn-dependent peptidase